MGTLVLDDLVDDPRVGGAQEAPGGSSRRSETSRTPPTAEDPRDHQHADRDDGRRRAR